MGRYSDVAIVGLGETPVGHVPDMTTQEMLLRSITAAVDDAGLTMDEIDGIYTAGTRVDLDKSTTSSLAEQLNIRPKVLMTMPIGGLQFGASIYQAACLIESGVIDNMVLACADNPLSGLSSAGTIDRYAFDAAHPEFEAPYGAAVFSLYALIAARHMHEYGTTDEQMAAVTVAMRRNAARHPNAVMRTPVTVDDVLASPMISTPYRRLNCSLISDGGGAVVISRAERAKDLKNRPVYLLGAGESRDHMYISQAEDILYSSAQRSSEIAYAEAGLTPSDLDFACVYDAYGMMTIVSIEAIGICAKGEGGPFVESEGIAYDGKFCVNPHGGLIAYAHPGRSGGWLNTIEAIHQLRGDAGERQLPATVGLVQSNASCCSGQVTLIMSNERSVR